VILGPPTILYLPSLVLSKYNISITITPTVFAYYLAENYQELRDKLNIINVLRAVEVIQLFKASQSATERAFSIVGKVVQGRY